MDNKKIGKLIADLRKQKGMTQQELGDKIGVGFRAVSKWERGLTLPDIDNINELSKILGITSDELLTGELNKENKIKDKNKKSSKFIKIIITVITLIAIILALIIYHNNKTYAYNISNTTDEYYIEGKIIFRGDDISIMINKIDFKDKDFASTVIKNYEYKVDSDEENIFRKGYIPLTNLIDKPTSIKNFTKNFNINYNGKTNLKRTNIVNKDISINFIFLDENNNEIRKEIKLKFSELDKK